MPGFAYVGKVVVVGEGGVVELQINQSGGLVWSTGHSCLVCPLVLNDSVQRPSNIVV